MASHQPLSSRPSDDIQTRRRQNEHADCPRRGGLEVMGDTQAAYSVLTLKPAERTPGPTAFELARMAIGHPPPSLR